MDKKDYLKFLGKPKISYINFFQPNQQTQIKQTIKKYLNKFLEIKTHNSQVHVEPY